jgi:hypothetical protein
MNYHYAGIEKDVKAESGLMDSIHNSRKLPYIAVASQTAKYIIQVRRQVVIYWDYSKAGRTCDIHI